MCGRIQFFSHVLVFGDRSTINSTGLRHGNQLVVIGVLQLTLCLWSSHLMYFNLSFLYYKMWIMHFSAYVTGLGVMRENKVGVSS